MGAFSEGILGQEEAHVHTCKTGSSTENAYSQECVRYVLKFDKQRKMLGSLGCKKVFRRQQLLQKWQINDTGFLELDINCQRVLNSSCTLGHLQRHLETLFPVWLFGCVEVPLLFFQREDASCPSSPPCHVFFCAAGSDVTELSEPLVWSCCVHMGLFVSRMKKKHGEPWQQFQVSWCARFCFSQLWANSHFTSEAWCGFLAQMPILISEIV